MIAFRSRNRPSLTDLQYFAVADGVVAFFLSWGMGLTVSVKDKKAKKDEETAEEKISQTEKEIEAQATLDAKKEES